MKCIILSSLWENIHFSVSKHQQHFMKEEITVIEKRQNPILQEPRKFKCKRSITTSACTISTLYQNTLHIKHRFRFLLIRL